jgi:hypothetical protein
MLKISPSRRTGAMLITGAVLTLLLAPRAADANINLELRPVAQTAFVSSIFNVDLYAVSDSLVNQTLSAAQVIITWNPAFVQYFSLDNTGTPMLSSTVRGDPYGLNTSLTDGDLIWVGFAPPGAGNAVPATPLGTFLTRFRFQALAPTFPGTTPIDIAATGGNGGHTIVFDGTTPNLPVTGSLHGAVVTVIAPAPGALAALLGGLLMAGRRRRENTPGSSPLIGVA